MAKHAEPGLTAVQLEIMDLFWEHGELGVAQVWKHLSARRTIARNTVQTTLSRLADKGWLRARAEGNSFQYRAARTRQRAVGGILRNLVDSAFSGSATGLVMALLESRRLAPEEVERIRQLINAQEE
jgi:BlaI family transcriptional regulator, penicillinase repressor